MANRSFHLAGPNAETHRFEVTVEAEDIAYPLFSHQNKRQAVGEGNRLIGKLPHLHEGVQQIVFVRSQPLNPGS